LLRRYEGISSTGTLFNPSMFAIVFGQTLTKHSKPAWKRGKTIIYCAVSLQRTRAGQFHRAYGLQPLKQSSFGDMFVSRAKHSSFSQPFAWQGRPLFIFLSLWTCYKGCSFVSRCTGFLCLNVVTSIFKITKRFCMYPLEDVEASEHKNNGGKCAKNKKKTTEVSRGIQSKCAGMSIKHLYNVYSRSLLSNVGNGPGHWFCLCFVSSKLRLCEYFYIYLYRFFQTL